MSGGEAVSEPARRIAPKPIGVDEAARAARTIASAARDANDAALLLDMLGLDVWEIPHLRRRRTP